MGKAKIWRWRNRRGRKWRRDQWHGGGSHDSLGTWRLKINAGRAFTLCVSISHTCARTQCWKYPIFWKEPGFWFHPMSFRLANQTDSTVKELCPCRTYCMSVYAYICTCMTFDTRGAVWKIKQQSFRSKTQCSRLTTPVVYVHVIISMKYLPHVELQAFLASFMTKLNGTVFYTDGWALCD